MAQQAKVDISEIVEKQEGTDFVNLVFFLCKNSARSASLAT